MADVPVQRRRSVAIDRWATKIANMARHKHVDAMLSVTILSLALMIGTVSVVNTIVHRPVYTFEPGSFNDSLSYVYSNGSRAHIRRMAALDEAMHAACHNRTAVVAHEIKEDGVPMNYSMFCLCDEKLVFKNPTIVYTGNFHGRCEETYENITKIKRRSFPLHMNHSDGSVYKASSLSKACSLMHAYELMVSTW
jgi:hypothetical protein